MNWTEIIELRSLSLEHEALKELKRTGTEADRMEGLKGIEMYYNASVTTDMSIHIHWSTKDDQIRKSALGLRLASALTEFGRVNHTIWIKD